MASFSDRLAERLLFDRKDHTLLSIVSEALSREDISGVKRLLTPFLHPRGVKELAATQGLRIAYAAANLLDSLEIGKAADRLNALQGLREEVMNASRSLLRRNAARVLLQIMKELLRAGGERRRQLELAHDFRMAVDGRPRFIRRMLKRYHLVPMPEDWTQICFDGHVHDANTKGRKSATHLIMDAWIKGIRQLAVVYYHFVPPSAAEELLRAAEIMGVTVHIGIEFATRAFKKQVKIIWVPRGFDSPAESIKFLREPAMEEFTRQGQSLVKLQEEQLASLVHTFNASVLPGINAAFGIDAPAVPVEGFLPSVGSGQASMFHLGKYIHGWLLPYLRARFEDLQERYGAADAGEKARIELLATELNGLDADALVDNYLEHLVSPQAVRMDAAGSAESPGACSIEDGRTPGTGGPPASAEYGGASALYCHSQTPGMLVEAVATLHVGSNFILNLQDLYAEEVLSILNACDGRITHLEIVNLRNADQGRAPESRQIAQLQAMVNEQSVIGLKRWVMERIRDLEANREPRAKERLTLLTGLLENIAALHARYRGRPLRTSIGSDSTGQSSRGHGMGLAVLETLPPGAVRKAGIAARDPRGVMVVGLDVRPEFVFERRESPDPWLNSFYAFARRHGAIRRFGYRASRRFADAGFRPVQPGHSNILILGGAHSGSGNQFTLSEPSARKAARLANWPYLRTSLKNTLKVAGGFIPAFLAFFLAHDWVVLTYFGAFIWFGITGLRNIIQSVLGGGGIARTPLLRWNSYVRWTQVCESLLYTGLSVPLLDYLVKTLLLDRGLHINVATNPTALYAIMALVNGLYIFIHNTLRGFPRRVAVWNLGRSLVSIPVAMGLSGLLGMVLFPGNPLAAGRVLQQWAAVLSKLASDGVGGVVEGLADRGINMRERLRDYREKIAQMQDVREKLDILFPTADVSAMMGDPSRFVATVAKRRKDLANALMVNALDCLYFWMYQPRARSALAKLVHEMDAQTREIFLASQRVLVNKREISQLFLDGILGKNFSAGLAFYLDYAAGYLQALERLFARTKR